MKKLPIFIMLFLLVLPGCGYTTKAFLSPNLKTVYVDNFRNNIDITRETEYTDHYRIYRPGLERKVTKAVKNRFMFDGTLKVVNNPDRADSELSGEIIDFRKEPLQYTANKAVDEYRLKIIVTVKFTNLADNAVLLDKSEIVGETTYTLSGVFAKSESSAQQDTVDDLARRIVERVIEGW